jgi:GMP synthase-like glutamine amidotransferase
MLSAEAELRRVVARSAPVLGVCFGHQLLAQALGGEVQPNERGREMSTVAIERLADDPLFAGLGQRFNANACHSGVPAGFKVYFQTWITDPAASFNLAASNGLQGKTL